MSAVTNGGNEGTSVSGCGPESESRAGRNKREYCCSICGQSVTEAFDLRLGENDYVPICRECSKLEDIEYCELCDTFIMADRYSYTEECCEWCRNTGETGSIPG